MTDGILLAEIQTRPRAAAVRHADHRRGPRAQPQHRLHPRLPQAAAAPPPRPQGDHHLGDHRPRAVRPRTSATPAERPVVEVSGRTYPVEVRYRPLSREARRGRRRQPSAVRDQIQAICDAVDELCAEGPGDILVFLSGEREIRDTADALAPAGRCRDTGDPAAVRPAVHRRAAPGLPAAHRPPDRARHQRRRDLADRARHQVRHRPGHRPDLPLQPPPKVQRLPIEPVSQASANQRKGRCGRTSDGICIRLYAEEDFAARPGVHRRRRSCAPTSPRVILQMTALGLGDIAAFPFIDPPDRRNIPDGVKLLQELGALDADQRPHRRSAASSPSCRSTRGWPAWCSRPTATAASREVMVIAAALSIQDPRERPAEQQAQADQQHARFADTDSDFLAYLNLWQLPPGAAEGAVVQRVPPDVQGRVPQLPAGPRVAGHLRPAAPGRPHARPGHVQHARGPSPADPPGRCSPACSRTSACKDGDKQRVPRRPRRQVRDLPRLGAVQEAAALRDGGRAGRDLPAVGPGQRPDRAGVGRAARRAPGQAHLQRAALGEEAGGGDGVREGHAVRRPDRGAAQGQLRPDRPGAVPGAVHPARAGRGRLADPPPVLRTTTGRCSTRSRSWSTGPAAATSWSTTRRCSTSTTSGSPPTSSPAGTSTPGGRRPAAQQPDLLDFDRDDAGQRRPAATSTRATTPTPGARVGRACR